MNPRTAVVFLFSLPLLAAENTISTPANLIADGIPPIPAALMEKLQRYNESRSARLLDWHPSKREILIATRFGDVPQVHRVAMPGGARSQLTFLPDRVGSALYRPDGASFVFSRDTGGAEFYQLYLCDGATGDITLLTDGSSRNTGAIWSTRGRYLAYASTRRNGRDTDLYVEDASDPKSARMLMQVEGGGWQVMDWSPDDRLLLVRDERSVNDATLYLVNAETGAKHALTPGGKASWDNAHFAPDGKSIWLTTNLASPFERIANLDSASGRLSFPRPSLPWDVTDLEISRDGRHLAYIMNENGYSVLHVMETAARTELKLPQIPRGVISGLKWHNNGNDLGFSLASARNPGDVFSIDLEKGTIERWTMSETGGLNAEAFSEPELIRWKTFDGRTISGFLYMPPAKLDGPRPVIINIHGGPEGQSRPGYLGRNNYYLNELGVALIFPNVRGSSGYGKAFLDLDNGPKREDSVRDIGALLDWIATRGDLDAKRVMVTGGSYGGYMTLASAFHFDSRLRCAIDVVGISNFNTFLQRTQAYRRDLRRVEYGDERDPKVRDFFNRTAPLTNVSKITKPMMIVAGKNDPRVPVEEGEQMTGALRSRGVPVWYLMAEDEGHGFAKKRNQDYQFAATVLFIERFLLNR